MDDAAYAAHVDCLFASAVGSGKWRAVSVDANDERYGRADIMPGRDVPSKYQNKGTSEGRGVRDACIELVG